MHDLVIHGDCLDVLSELEENSIDSIVTDPPYEIQFMNRSWDSTGVSFSVELWSKCLRVLKPGGHLISFGGVRTAHRITCAIEDAGFEIRDILMWLFGSGYPKSHDISKAIDRELGHSREKVAIPSSQVRNPKSINGGTGIDGGDRPWMQKAMETGYHEMDSNVPSSQEAKMWHGWGSALKPAYEPIIMARKPLSEKNLALNVLKWGTGGLNIDACRIDHNEKPKIVTRKAEDHFWTGKKPITKPELHTGRWPANLLLDGFSAFMLDEQTGTLKSGLMKKGTTRLNSEGEGKNTYGYMSSDKVKNDTYGDSGGASRFFYCAKVSPKERTACQKVDNKHPTVKPINLMKYLITLVTPACGLVLDPFSGSGSTLIAAALGGFHFVGIEREEEYVKIARARIAEFVLDTTVNAQGGT